MNNKIRTIILAFFALLFVFNISFVQADSCDELKPAIDKYYKASQAENIDEYLSVMDIDYIRENLLDNYEDYLKSAWESYDTKSYELEVYNCKIENESALMYLNLKSTLVSEEHEYELQKNYVANFTKVDSWKIKYVIDEEVFSQFQNSLYSQLFLEAIKENIYAELDKADDLISYAMLVEEVEAGDYENTISEGAKTRKSIEQKKEGKSFGGIFLFVFVIIVFILAKNKKLRKKLFNLITSFVKN